jgi:hypothetical protein
VETKLKINKEMEIIKVSGKRLYHEYTDATEFDELRAWKGCSAQKSATHKNSFKRIKRTFTKKVRRALKVSLNNQEL